MCIFTGPVDVSKTNVFVARVGVKEQLTVYSNTVALPGKVQDSTGTGLWGDGSSQWSGPQSPPPQQQQQPTSMVLPIPMYGASAMSSIRMIDMTADPDFFERLAEATTPPTTNEYLGRTRCASTGSLEVRRCGPYRYSVVPNVDAFERLRSDVFGTRAGLAGALRQRYASAHAFLVCIIDASSAFSPIAYVHPLPADAVLFVPTLHEHGHGIGPFADDWDHRVYSIDASFDTALLDGRKVEVSALTRAHAAPVLSGTFAFPRLDWSRLGCRRIKGRQPNGDIGIRGYDFSSNA